MEATGLTDILMEAGLVGSGTIGRIVNRKNYSRASASHKTVLEALQRLIAEAVLESRNETSVFESLPVDSKVDLRSITLTCPPNKEDLDEAFKVEAIAAYIEAYLEFKKRIRNGSLNKTAQFWTSHMDHVCPATE